MLPVNVERYGQHPKRDLALRNSRAARNGGSRTQHRFALLRRCWPKGDRFLHFPMSRSRAFSDHEMGDFLLVKKFLRPALQITNLENLLAIPDREFQKYTAIQQCNLVARFAATNSASR